MNFQKHKIELKSQVIIIHKRSYRTRLWLLLFSLILFAKLTTPHVIAKEKTENDEQAKISSARIYMPDGQHINRWVKIFIEGLDSQEKFSKDSVKTLFLLCKGKKVNATVQYVSKDQQYERKNPDGPTPDTVVGTLLLCSVDLKKVEKEKLFGWKGWKPAAKVRPVVKLVDRTLTGDFVTIANSKSAVIITCSMLLLVLLLLWWFGRNDEGLVGLLKESSGRLSLTRTQIALFTLGIGGTTFGYGLMMPESPEIHPTLLFLMGVPLAGGALSHFREKQVKCSSNNEPTTTPSLVHLISIDVGNGSQLSIPRAQMVFWTIVTLCLFVGRSLTSDTLWEVPWQLVVLMGMSQAGYVGAKYAPPDSLNYKVPETLSVNQELNLIPTWLGAPIRDFTVKEGELPPGMQLNPSSGFITGKPTKECAGKTFTVVIAAKAFTGHTTAVIVFKFSELVD